MTLEAAKPGWAGRSWWASRGPRGQRRCKSLQEQITECTCIMEEQMQIAGTQIMGRVQFSALLKLICDRIVLASWPEAGLGSDKV